MKQLLLIGLVAISPLIALEYKGSVTVNERKDIHYVIQNMAKGKAHAALKMFPMKAAGKRIKHLHPLDFLQCSIERSGDFRGIKSDNFLWKSNLVADAVKGLEREAKENNLDEHLPIFSENIYKHVSQKIAAQERNPKVREAKSNEMKKKIDALTQMVKEQKFEQFVEGLREITPGPKNKRRHGV